MDEMKTPHIADIHHEGWREHARFPGISMKNLLTPEDNPLASVNAVRVPPGGVITRHRHPTQCETVYVIAGNCVLTLAEAEHELCAGQVIAIPAGLEHALRNEGQTLVELLTIFTPPLT